VTSGWDDGFSFFSVVGAGPFCVRRVSVPADVIAVAVRWYLRYNLSYRDVEELLIERGVVVDQLTVCRWVQRFTPGLHRRGATMSALGRRPLVRRRDLREGLRSLVLSVPGPSTSSLR
jgi:hypothetical protein